MLLIAVSYRRYGMNLRAKLETVINSLSDNHAYLKTLYLGGHFFLEHPVVCFVYRDVVFTGFENAQSGGVE